MTTTIILLVFSNICCLCLGYAWGAAQERHAAMKRLVELYKDAMPGYFPRCTHRPNDRP
jgi:hypothetical protein